MSEQTEIEYVQIAVNIGHRLGYISLPKDVKPKEVEIFIKQLKKLKVNNGNLETTYNS